MRSGLLALLVCAFASLALAQPANAANKVTVGVLKFGTVSWVLDTIRANGLDKAEGIELDIVPLASTQATTVGLQGGSVDIIATDWLWVSRERSGGGDFTFSPFTTALGAIMVPPNSPIKTLGDLKGKRLGVAGGPLDKSWLLLVAYALQDRQSRLEERDHAGIRRAASPGRTGEARRARCRSEFLALCGEARGRRLHPADRGRGRGERARRQGRGRHGRLCLQRELGQAKS